MCGLEISVTCCCGCGRELPEHKAAFFAGRRGGVVCSSCGGGPLLLNKEGTYLLKTLSQNTLQDACNQSADSAIYTDLERAVDSFTLFHIEKDLQNTGFRK
jgi:recombinational DNA repair protein (RecF pathway)